MDNINTSLIIKEIMRKLRIGVLEFSRQTGLSRSNIYGYLDLKKDYTPGLDKLRKMVEAYPALSAEYLLLGTGPIMLELNDNEQIIKPTNIPFPNRIKEIV